jgi:hypothetical protein
MPVIACLFFMASVVYVGDASVSLCLLLLVSSSWLVLSMLEMQVAEPHSLILGNLRNSLYTVSRLGRPATCCFVSLHNIGLTLHCVSLERGTFFF